MAFLDFLTGRASKRAAQKNEAVINGAIASGTGALTNGTNSALGMLGTNNGGNAIDALTEGYTQARGDVSAGYDGAAPALSRLGESYGPMIAGGKRSFDAFLDGSGANGAEGNARAVANFQAGPGYEFQRDQSLEAIQRSAAARGGLAGGNLTSDMLKTATGLADQSWNSYLGNLKSGADYYQTGLAGQGQGLAAQAGASVARGTALGALGTGLGTGQAALYGQGANTQTALGQNLANLQIGGAQSLVQNNNNLAASQNQAGANAFNAILGIGQLATGNLGGALGSGSRIGSSTGDANVSPSGGSSLLSSLSSLNPFR